MMNNYSLEAVDFYISHTNERKKPFTIYYESPETFLTLLKGNCVEILNEAQSMEQESYQKQDRARLRIYRATLLYEMGNRESAERSLQEAISIWPHPNNNAYKLLKYYKSSN